MTIIELWQRVQEEILSPYCASGCGCRLGDNAGHDGRCVWKANTPEEKVQLLSALVEEYCEERQKEKYPMIFTKTGLFTDGMAMEPGRIVALHNAFPALQRELLAGRKLAEAVKQYADNGCTCLGLQAPCAHKKTATALAEYESSL